MHGLSQGATSVTSIIKSSCRHGHELTEENTFVRGHLRQCRVCLRRYKREWKKGRSAEALEKVRAYNREHGRRRRQRPEHKQYMYKFLRKKRFAVYGITESEYNKMLEAQCGLCAICQSHYKDIRQTLHVDHCHKTKKIRGLLCRECNLALGHIKDNIKSLNMAISYLERNLLEQEK